MSGLDVLASITINMVNIGTSLYILTLVKECRSQFAWGKWVIALYLVVSQAYFGTEAFSHMLETSVWGIGDTAVLFLLFSVFTCDSFHNFFKYQFYFIISKIVYRGLCLFFLKVAGLASQEGSMASVQTLQGWVMTMLFLGLAWEVIIYIGRQNLFEKIPVPIVEMLVFYQLMLYGAVIALEIRNVTRNFTLDIVMLGACAQIVFTYFAFLWSKREKEIYENKMLQSSLNRQAVYYERYYQFQEDMKKIRHDLSNHVSVIQNLAASGEKQKAEEYKQQLESACDKMCARLSFEPWEEKEEILGISSKEKIIKYISLFSCLSSFFILQVLLYEKKFVLLICIFTILMLFLASIYLALMLKEKQMAKENRWLETQLHQWEIGHRDFTYQASQARGIKEWLDKQYDASSFQKQLMAQYDMVIDRTLTGNFPVDAMLHAKLRKCRLHGIQTEIHLTLDEESQMQDIDTVGLLGNLLDNAIESCMTGEEEQRFIHLRSQTQANFWKIRIDNYIAGGSGSPVERNFATTKSDKTNHGLGMKIVQTIVDKYEGLICFEQADHTFSITVMVKVR